MKHFIRISGAVLFVTGVAKLLSGLSSGQIVHTRDPVTELQFGSLFKIVGGLEMLIGVFCILTKRINSAALILACLSTSFICYRLGLYFLGYHKPCRCLGNFTDALHISPMLADNIMKVVLCFLFLGSYTILIAVFIDSRKQYRPATQKFSRPIV